MAPTATGGGSMQKLVTAKNSFIRAVKEMQTTLSHTKSAKIIVVMPEVCFFFTV